ncbi:MAG TPA: SPFH domain-containing protein [Candidatus Dormibacteraeota bacterium]|nr:SPFH domain-containing protein [Candidatus Dormibacteraeota bacterium]
MTPATIAVLVIALLLVLILVRAIVHIVPAYQKLVVFRFGNFDSVKGPGLILLLPPPIQSSVTADLREFVVEIPEQTSITKDNAPIGVDFLIFQKVVEPKDSVINVQNFRQNVQGIASTTLRAVVGDMTLDDVLSKREQINEILRVKLDEETGRWGVKVIRVEIRQINPPREIQEAMSRQLSAERNRRAAILEAEGKKQSAILVAEGSKQSAILEAEGQRQAQILKAEGFSLALTRIFEAAQSVDAKTMTLQYLDALRALGASPATKFVIPTEFSGLAASLTGFARDGVTAERK